MPGEKPNENLQENKNEQKNQLAIWLTQADLQALESKYPKINNKDDPSLKFALNAIASPKSTGGLWREFVTNTILKHNANVPKESIIALAKELNALQQQQHAEQQAALSADEVKQLETLLTDVNTKADQITTFFTQQKDEFTTVSEVVPTTPEQQKSLEIRRQNIEKEIATYTNITKDPDLTQNLTVSLLDRYGGRINDAVKNSKAEETKLQINAMINRGLFVDKNTAITADQQAKLKTVLSTINTAMATQENIYASYTAQDFTHLLQACIIDGKAITDYRKPTEQDAKALVTLWKDLQGTMELFTQAKAGNQTMETIATVSKKVFDNLSKVGEWMKDYIENNFGTFETIFAIPLIGPFLKELFVGKKWEEADRYKSAKAVYEKKLATLTAGEQVVSAAIAEKYNDLDKDQSDTHTGELNKKLIAQSWFTGLYTAPTETKASLTTEQSKGKNTQESLQKFDDVAYLKTLFDADTIGKLTKDTIKIGEKDPLYGKDIKAYLLTTMYMRLGNTESVANKLAQERITEFKNDTPSDQLQKDFASYAEGRLWKICGEQKVSFAWPMDIVNALTFDLLKDSDQAVIARLKPAVVTAPATTPAAPANAPASAPAVAPQPAPTQATTSTAK